MKSCLAISSYYMGNRLQLCKLTTIATGLGIMQSDPRGTTETRALLVIGGVIIFGTPIYYVLAVYLGAMNATIAVFILLAVAAFIIVRRYFNRRRLDNRSANQPYRSTGATRDWPQKYGKHRHQSYSAAVNSPGKLEPTPIQRNLLKVLRFALKPLQFAGYILSNRTKGDIKKDELLHRQTRNTPWW